MEFKEFGRGSIAWYLKHIKKLDGPGVNGIAKEVGMAWGDVNLAVKQLEGGRYIENKSLKDSSRPQWRLTSFGHRYLEENKKESMDPSDPVPDADLLHDAAVNLEVQGAQKDLHRAALEQNGVAVEPNQRHTVPVMPTIVNRLPVTDDGPANVYGFFIAGEKGVRYTINRRIVKSTDIPTEERERLKPLIAKAVREQLRAARAKNIEDLESATDDSDPVDRDIDVPTKRTEDTAPGEYKAAYSQMEQDQAYLPNDVSVGPGAKQPEATIHPQTLTQDGLLDAVTKLIEAVVIDLAASKVTGKEILDELAKLKSSEGGCEHEEE